MDRYSIKEKRNVYAKKKINHRPLEYLHKRIEELGFFKDF